MMKNISVFLALILALSTCILITTQEHSTYYSESIPYEQIQEKITHLRFFFHDILSGNKPTAVQIAGPKKPNDPVPFGSLFAIDDPLTEGPEITSKVVGNARGMYVQSSQRRHNSSTTLVVYIDLGFTSGKFNGSSLSVFSRNPITEPFRELAVVGGRGLFRSARGSAFLRTVFFNATTGDTVVEYSVEVVHP